MTIKQLIQTQIEQIPESELEDLYQLIKNFINKKNIFLNKQQKLPYHDLDYLAGTWNQKDETEFIDNTRQFTKIDQNLWQ
jgi:hypothetical protein